MRVLQKCLAAVLIFATAAGCTSPSPNAETSTSESVATVHVPEPVDETAEPAAETTATAATTTTSTLLLVGGVRGFKFDALSFGLRFQATKCGGIAGTWEFTINTTDGNYQPTSTLIVVVDSDPVPGGPPVQVISGPLRFYDPVVRAGYEENFVFNFYGDGADSPSEAARGAPAIGIDEVLGGGVYPIVAGNFC